MSFIATAVSVGGAIASTVGTVAGTIGGAVASGLGALGMGTAAVPSALASGIGSFVGGAATGSAIGSGLGAAGSAIAGGDPGQGAAMGALTGGATGGIGGLMGGAGGAASSAVGGIQGSGTSFIEQAAQQGLGATAETAVPVGSTAQSLASSAAPILNSGATSALSGGFTGFGKAGDFLAKTAGEKALTGGANAISQNIANTQTEEDSNKVKQQYFSSWAHGGEVQHVAREGGSIRLRNGDFIIPADVVSALGNGSSKAGAKYLTHLMRALDAGPQPRAGSLAKSRAKARHA